MTYDVYRYIFIIAAILCGVMFLVSIILFFALKIPKVIGDLTGYTAKKAIKNIRDQNEESGNKTYKTSAINKGRGMLTDKISKSGKLVERDEERSGAGMMTMKISTQNIKPLQNVGDETTLLSEAGETTLLAENIAENQPMAGETEVLSAPPVENIVYEQQPVENIFVIEFEITYIHTNEIIEG